MSDSKMWARHVAGWQSSGLSRPEYARREGLAVSALNYWARKLSREPGMELVRVTRAPTERAAPHLLLEVQGVRVLVGTDFDRELLGRVLDVLRARAAS